MKNVDYYSVPAISNSFLSQGKAEVQGRQINPSSAAFRFGRNIHEFFLKLQKYDFRQYTGKERLEVMRMRKTFYQAAGDYIQYGNKEQEYYYDNMGYKCKMKADEVNCDQGGGDRSEYHLQNNGGGFQTICNRIRVLPPSCLVPGCSTGLIARDKHFQNHRDHERKTFSNCKINFSGKFIFEHTITPFPSPGPTA